MIDLGFFKLPYAKGQLISKGLFKVFICTKKMDEIIFVFLLFLFKYSEKTQNFAKSSPYFGLYVL